VPEHLQLQLTGWLTEIVKPGTRNENTYALDRVMARLRIPPVPWGGREPRWAAITHWYEGEYEGLEDNGERLLDVINVVIRPLDRASRCSTKY
jgi:hypothetical protein